MAFTESRFPPSDERAENVPDMIPVTERNQDPVTTEITHELTAEAARPLTEAERKAADREAPAGRTVYAPASKRVPVKPVAGHREFVDHPDTHTAERAAASPASIEPPFARVPRPTTSPMGSYASATTRPNWTSSSWENGSSSGKWLGMSIGWLTLATSSAVGVWLWLRWQRARNAPLNRLRRQARLAAGAVRR